MSSSASIAGSSTESSEITASTSSISDADSESEVEFTPEPIVVPLLDRLKQAKPSDLELARKRKVLHNPPFW